MPINTPETLPGQGGGIDPSHGVLEAVTQKRKDAITRLNRCRGHNPRQLQERYRNLLQAEEEFSTTILNLCEVPEESQAEARQNIVVQKDGVHVHWGETYVILLWNGVAIQQPLHEE